MINPKKSLSQNFLKDKNICKKIVSEANINNNLVLEIGPGYVILTDFFNMFQYDFANIRGAQGPRARARAQTNRPARP